MLYQPTLIGRPVGGLLGRLLRGLGEGRFGQLLITTADGCSHLLQGQEAGPQASLQLRRPWRFLGKLLAEGDVGFARSYLDGDWCSDDLDTLLQWGLRNEPYLQGLAGLSGSGRLKNRLRHWLAHNSLTGSRRNIAYHYDLGNDFYRLWLDPGMTYSSALFNDWNEPLQTAQTRKYQRLLAMTDARPGERLLEIGCGWGAMAAEAAAQGLDVTGVTLSREQLQFARAQISAQGLQQRVELQLRDYRQLDQQYDRIVSVEMFEAVGERYWPLYFNTVARLLKPGGKLAIQTITIDDDYFDHYRDTPEFIQLYIFPGGMLPSVSRFTTAAHQAGLAVEHYQLYGEHYAHTLRLWRQSFESRIEQIKALGMDERFIRMWRYYLSYCEQGFRDGRINLMQAALHHSTPAP